MDPLTASVTIGRPREEVFAYLADIANHPEFTDHYLREWHLTRVNSYGKGAGARFRVKAPLNRFSWADVVIDDVSAPQRIVMRGRGGKYNRTKIVSSYVLTPVGPSSTRVEFTMETQPVLPSDRLLEAIGRRSLRRGGKKAMRRLRSILEEGAERGTRATVAGGGQRFSSGGPLAGPVSK